MSAVIHAQRADQSGNVLIEGIIGAQKEVVLASKSAIVTVEEVVEDLAAPSLNSVVLPHWTIDAIVIAPGGSMAFVHPRVLSPRQRLLPGMG